MTQRNLEELIHHMKTIARVAESEWAKSFAKSILHQSKRPGWTPSVKQEAMMRCLVAELFTHEFLGDVIEVDQ